MKERPPALPASLVQQFVLACHRSLEEAQTLLAETTTFLSDG